MNAHQVHVILVIDTRVLGCVADSLQEHRFASISPTDYKDTKTSIFRSEVIGITVAHDRCGLGGCTKERTAWEHEFRALTFTLRPDKEI